MNNKTFWKIIIVSVVVLALSSLGLLALKSSPSKQLAAIEGLVSFDGKTRQIVVGADRQKCGPHYECPDGYVCTCYQTADGGGSCDCMKKITEEKVTLTTNKTEYLQGEPVKITIKNNSSATHIIYHPYYMVERFGNNVWTLLKREWCPCYSCGMPVVYSLRPLELEMVWFEWNQNEEWCGERQFTQRVPAGKYRISSSIIETDAIGNHISKVTIYSNEFTIKEKSTQEVIITTDKTEYAPGEKISASASFNDSVYVWPDGIWKVLKQENGQWKTVARTHECPNPPRCNDINFATRGDKCLWAFCERSMWYKINNSHTYAQWTWDGTVETDRLSYPCTMGATNLTEECINFAPTMPGKYIIQFEYALVADENSFQKEGVMTYFATKEITIN